MIRSSFYEQITGATLSSPFTLTTQSLVEVIPTPADTTDTAGRVEILLTRAAG